MYVQPLVKDYLTSKEQPYQYIYHLWKDSISTTVDHLSFANTFQKYQEFRVLTWMLQSTFRTVIRTVIAFIIFGISASCPPFPCKGGLSFSPQITKNRYLATTAFFEWWATASKDIYSYLKHILFAVKDSSLGVAHWDAFLKTQQQSNPGDLKWNWWPMTWPK